MDGPTEKHTPSPAARTEAESAVQEVMNDMASDLREDGLTKEEAGKELLNVLADPTQRSKVIKAALKKRERWLSKRAQAAGMNRAERRRAKGAAKKEVRRIRKEVKEAGT